MEMTFNTGSFQPLAFEEMLEIDGGRNWVSTVAGGAGIVGGASTIVCAWP